MIKFQNVGIVGRLGSDSVVSTLHNLSDLLESLSVNYVIDESLKSVANLKSANWLSRELLGQQSDLIIVIGGDGTLLGAARDLAQYEKPVLGINRGRLGFLTDIMPDDIDPCVIDVLKGHYKVEDRFLLQVEIYRGGQLIDSGTALNDVVLHPGQSIRMIEFELEVDQQFVYSQRSDGLIVSTPTGSTAYALSAGGPIMHPKLNALVLVPMFPHALSSRPIVVDADSELRVRIGLDNALPPQVSCDAQTHLGTEPGDELLIKKLQHKLHLLHPLYHNYYETCRTKLGWGRGLQD